MTQEYIISAVGGNRPGVVAELTKWIYLAGINIENSCMTLLADHFTLMIHVRSEREDAYSLLEEHLREMEKNSDIPPHIFPAASGPEAGSQGAAGTRYALRVRGEDRSGIVFKTSQFLASRGVNILEMETRVEKDPQRESPLFRMYTLIEVPESVNREQFRSDLETLANELQESITLTKASSGR